MLTFVYKEICPSVCDSCWTSIGSCFDRNTRKCCFFLTLGDVKKETDITHGPKIERGWRPPPYCNGSCKGAKIRRKIHRKEIRINKRAGLKVEETPWFKTKYTCTCKVKDTMPIVKICQGFWFFFYCPCLPAWWVLDLVFKTIKRKIKRRRKLKKFRKQRAVKDAKKAEEYVHLDEYSRGQETSEITKLDQDIKKLRQMEREFRKFDLYAHSHTHTHTHTFFSFLI